MKRKLSFDIYLFCSNLSLHSPRRCIITIIFMEFIDRVLLCFLQNGCHYWSKVLGVLYSDLLLVTFLSIYHEHHSISPHSLYIHFILYNLSSILDFGLHDNAFCLHILFCLLGNCSLLLTFFLYPSFCLFCIAYYKLCILYPHVNKRVIDFH